jgi:hypothetical protein
VIEAKIAVGNIWGNNRQISLPLELTRSRKYGGAF